MYVSKQGLKWMVLKEEKNLAVKEKFQYFKNILGKMPSILTDSHAKTIQPFPLFQSLQRIFL